jgi:hypothetical protein
MVVVEDTNVRDAYRLAQPLFVPRQRGFCFLETGHIPDESLCRRDATFPVANGLHDTAEPDRATGQIQPVLGVERLARAHDVFDTGAISRCDTRREQFVNALADHRILRHA